MLQATHLIICHPKSKTFQTVIPRNKQNIIIAILLSFFMTYMFKERQKLRKTCKWVIFKNVAAKTKSPFTCNRDEISSQDENFCLHMSFILGWNLIWKKTSHWIWKQKTKLIFLAWYVKTSDDYFFRKVTLFMIFVCFFSY